MAMTTLGDVFAADRTAAYEVIQSYMDTDPVTLTPFFESGLIVSNPILAEVAQSGTGIVELPFWARIDASIEPNYSNDVYEDIAVPRALGTGSLRARNAYLNEAFGNMDLVTDITGRDPLQRVANRLQGFWEQQAERRIVATLTGIFNDNHPDNGGSGDMIADAGTTPTYDGILSALETLGDAFDSVTGFVMHSAVFMALVREGLATVSTTPDTRRTVRTLDGKPVIVNDTATTVTVLEGAAPGTPTNHRLTVALGANAFGYGMAQPSTPLEYEREAARGNGGGAETLWTRRNMIVHPLGYDFTSASITGNGTETTPRSAGWTDLTNAANWDRVADRKQVPIAFMISNA